MPAEESKSQVSGQPTRDRQVRVFIFSTFRDMHAERDHLVTVVFPELRERVEQLGLEFFDVDLRFRFRPFAAGLRRAQKGYGA